MTDTPWIPQIGDVVVAWRGDDDAQPGIQRKVERITKTQIITDDGVRWSRESRRRVGDHSYRAPLLYRADDPRLAAAAQRSAEKADRARVARRLEDAAGWWVNHPTAPQRATELRAAVLDIASYIGLTVVDPSTLCQYTDDHVRTDGRGRCLLPADHVERGEWHAGIGWTSSLGSVPSAVRED